MVRLEDFETEAPPPETGVRRGLGIGARALLTLVGILSLTMAAGSVLLTQTVVGRGAVASFVQRELDGLVNGSVELGPILGGNLLTTVLLDRFVIRDEAGVEFVALDSVRMEYNPLGLLSGTYRFRSVTVGRARLLLHQDTTGAWNFDRIFARDVGAPPGNTRVLLTDLAVREGRVELRTPWSTEQDELWRIETVAPGQYERAVHLDSLSGLFPLVRITDPVRPLRIEMESVRTLAAVVSQTLPIERFNGAAVFRDSIDLRIDRLETPETSLEGDGWIVPGTPTAFEFDLQADALGLADLQWLPVPLPARGSGPADLFLYTRRDGVIVSELTEGDIVVDDSRVRGGFVVHLEDPPRFERMALELTPIRLALVDEVLEREPLIDGYVTGSVTGSGPITLLDLLADLEIADVVPDSGVRPSRIRVTGGLAIVEPRLMRGLDLDMERFEPRWTRAVGLESGLGGRATGRATLDGTVGGRVGFVVDSNHRLADGSLSSVTGQGTLDLTAEDAMMDVSLDLQPLSVRAIQPWLRGVALVGEVRGPLSAQGRLNDLRLVADLTTPRGLLTLDGRFDLESELRTYDGRLLARDIQMSQWIDGGPATSLAIEGRIVGEGTDPATLRARFDMTILPSTFEGARVDSSLIRFTLSEGLAVADTFAVRTSAGSIDGRGWFGLTSETSGSLILDLNVPDLSIWNDWIVPGRNPARETDDVSHLFAAFDDTGEQAQEGAPDLIGPPASEPDTIAGRATARGVLYGNVQDYSFGGRAQLLSLEYGAHAADSLQLTIDVPDPSYLGNMIARVEAERVRVFDRYLDRMTARWERQDSVRSTLQLSGTRDTTISLESDMSLNWTDAAKRVGVNRVNLTMGRRSLRLVEPATIEYGSRGFLAKNVVIASADGAMVQLDGVIPDSGSAQLDIAVRGIRLENALEVVGNPRDLAGELTFGATVRGTADAPLWDAHLDVSEPSIEGISYDGLTGDFSYSGRRLAIAMAVVGRGLELARVDGFLRTDLSMRSVERRLLDDPLSLTVVVDSMPLDALGIGFSTIRDVSGHARGRVHITGEPSALQFEGDTQIYDTRIFVPKLGVWLSEIEGRVTYAGSTARIDSLRMTSSAGGTASASGSVNLARLSDIGLELDLRANGFRALDRRTATVRLDGSGSLSGSYQSPTLAGDFQLSEGDVRTERFLRQRQAVDLSDPAIYSLIDTTVVMEQRLFETTRNPFLQNLRLDTRLTVGPDLWLRSDALEVEVAGQLNVRMDRATRELIAFGTLRLPRGSFRYSFGSSNDISSLLSRRLQISRGTVTFVGSPGMDPNLDIDAVFRTRSSLGPLEIQVHVRGTSLSPTMTTSSSPPLPEPERICYLLFSSPCIGAGAEGGEFASAIVREGLMGQVGNQFSQVLVGGVGLIDYLDIRSSGTSGSGLSGGGASGSLLYGTEVEIGRYLTPDIFVRATQPLGGLLPGAAVEWSFLPSWRLELSTEDVARRYSAYGNSLDAFSNRTWGLMLFREWDF